MSWQPIETAPKDGTHILLFGDWEGEIRVSDKDTIGVGHWGGYHWDCSFEDGYAVWCKPSHWMPLPEPPSPRLPTPARPQSGA